MSESTGKKQRAAGRSAVPEGQAQKRAQRHSANEIVDTITLVLETLEALYAQGVEALYAQGVVGLADPIHRLEAASERAGDLADAFAALRSTHQLLRDHASQASMHADDLVKQLDALHSTHDAQRRQARAIEAERHLLYEALFEIREACCSGIGTLPTQDIARGQLALERAEAGAKARRIGVESRSRIVAFPSLPTKRTDQ